MTNIPMTIEGLEKQFKMLTCIERNLVIEINAFRRQRNKVSRDRKEAYRKWQDAIKAAAK